MPAGRYFRVSHVRNALVQPDQIYHFPPMEWQARIDHYIKATGFPCSLFVAEDGRVVGTWIMGKSCSR